MKMWDSHFGLEGERVRLVPMDMSHLDGLWEAAQNKEIWTYMAVKIETKDELKIAVEQAIEQREKGLQYPFTVVDRANNKVIGSTRYMDISPSNKSLEIGWTWYNPSVWRSPVNTESKFLLLTHAFESFEIHRVQFKTDSRNIRSQNAIARLGAEKEGVLRKERVLSDGYVRDTVIFSILQEEWKQKKGVFIEKLLKGKTS